MVDRSIPTPSLNIGLVVVISLLWLAIGLLVVGPGGTTLSKARQEVRALDARFSEWEDEFGGSVEVEGNDLRAWQQGYAVMRKLGPATAEEPGLTAWVASELRAPSIRGLEVSRRVARDEEVAQQFELQSPSRDESIVLSPVSITVRFYALYGDVLRVLGRIESENNAMKIERIQLKRNAPEIRVELDLALWTRSEAKS